MRNGSIPPDFLIHQAIGPKGTQKYYAFSGFCLSSGIRNILHILNRDLSNMKRVLDFGCGCGRVLRWFEDQRGSCKFYGTDINEAAIDWCSENLHFAKFSKNNPLPSLPYPNERFDLIYGISVFTHLNEDYQKAWLEELQRIIKPKGVLILTTHGDHWAYMDLLNEEYEKFRSNGFLYKRISTTGGVDGLPDFYQVAYHSREYVERVWSRFFKIRMYSRNAPFLNQDGIILQKDGLNERSYLYFDLPIGALGKPEFDAVVIEDQLVVSGWIFHPDGGTLNLDVWIDGHRVGSCVTGIPREGVSIDYPRYESAKSSGFSTTVPTKNLSRGFHGLWITTRTNLIPSLQTRFLLDRSYPLVP